MFVNYLKKKLCWFWMGFFSKI